MKKLFLKGALLLAPFLIYVGLVYVVNPFGLMWSLDEQEIEKRKPVSGKLNYALWKLTEFKSSPCSKILLGDSRMAGVKADSLNAWTDSNYCNLAYGGGNLSEVLSTFKYANSTTKLKRVDIGLGLTMVNNINNSTNRVDGVLKIFKNPLLHFTNRNVLAATLELLKDEPAKIGTPKSNRDRFWDQQLFFATDRQFRRFEYPDQLLEGLRSLASTCDSLGIDLNFVFFPVHDDVVEIISQKELTGDYDSVVDRVSEMGPVYDFRNEKSITSNRENFGDPFHLSYDVLHEKIAKSVWTN